MRRAASDLSYCLTLLTECIGSLEKDVHRPVGSYLHDFKHFHLCGMLSCIERKDMGSLEDLGSPEINSIAQTGWKSLEEGYVTESM